MTSVEQPREIPAPPAGDEVDADIQHGGDTLDTGERYAIEVATFVRE
ncbi:MAG: hypothetical protein H0W07_00055 [Chloroflexi bacterium]|nr:hypothetical protein [Chloroflexota bacterium]